MDAQWPAHVRVEDDYQLDHPAVSLALGMERLGPESVVFYRRSVACPLEIVVFCIGSVVFSQGVPLPGSWLPHVYLGKGVGPGSLCPF